MAVASGVTTTGISAALVPDGGISGSVTSASGGAGIAQVTVYVYDPAGNIVSSASTHSDGTYQITGLTPSTSGYTVCFNATGVTSGDGYFSQCYNDVAWDGFSAPPSGTTPVAVSPGTTSTGINAALTPEGGISGTVTSSSARESRR